MSYRGYRPSGHVPEPAESPHADEPDDLLADHDPGDIERSTVAYVESLGELDGHRAPLAATACALARAIDSGMKDTALPATARELRETLKDISTGAGDGGMDAVLARFSAPVDVPTKVGNAPKP